MKNIALSGIFLVCAFTTTAQSTDKILTAEEIIKLIPEKIEDFRQSDGSQSKVIQLGDLRYAVAERNFSASQKRSIKVLLFDYKAAPIMYNQATRKFNTFKPVETDSLILRSVTMTDCTGWESYNVNRKNSQILLGICNRFFLTIEGTNIDLESLKKVVQGFKIESFPK